MLKRDPLRNGYQSNLLTKSLGSAKLEEQQQKETHMDHDFALPEKILQKILINCSNYQIKLA